jgi:alkylation response protein AidB-like acyl-CoA dehydrogenase
VNFALTEDQQQLRAVARSYLEAKAPPSVVRELERDPLGYSPTMWSEIADMGWAGLALPGGGGDLVDLAVLFTELGRAVCPTPMFSTVALAGLTLADAGRLPAGVATGTTLIGTAMVDVDADALVLEPRGSAVRVTGTAGFAYDVEGADLLLAVAGPSVVLVDPSSGGVDAMRLSAMSADRLYELRLDGAEAEVVGDTAALVPAAVARATALRCCELVGVMERSVEMAAEHARTRVQFNKPLGAFQAVQHRLADMLIDLEGARLVAHRAVCALGGGASSAREVSVAKAWVADAGQRVAFGAQQVHGGVGVDVDYDLQLYFRRAKALEVELGSAPQHRARLADSLGLA